MSGAKSTHINSNPGNLINPFGLSAVNGASLVQGAVTSNLNQAAAAMPFASGKEEAMSASKGGVTFTELLGVVGLATSVLGAAFVWLRADLSDVRADVKDIRSSISTLTSKVADTREDLLKATSSIQREIVSSRPNR